MAVASRSYYGQAYAAKCYRGPKDVNIVLDTENAGKLAENLLKAVKAGKSTVDVAVYATDNETMTSGEKARITVTSGK
jgi:hypothetical protein